MTKRRARVPVGAPAPRPRPPREVKFPLKRATVKALFEIDGQVRTAQQQLLAVQQRMIDTLRPILTEQGIEEADVKTVDDSPPYTMTVLVKKFAKKER